MPFDLISRTLDIAAARRRFADDGFAVFENVLSSDQVEALRDAFPKLFAGKFDTGIYPDEWYWREEMSKPDVTRHMANAWKANLAVAGIALSPDLGKIASELTGWDGVRLGQDTIWWKPPGTKAVSYHQDSSFMDFLNPAKTVTCWIPLDDTHRDAGTLEYAPGSHKWPLTTIPEGFHAPGDYRALLKHAAEQSGNELPDPHYVEVPAGSLVFHSGEIWHGSGPNTTVHQMRRAIGVHFLPQSATFSDAPGGYIYRRYQLTGDPTLNDSFFPVTWSSVSSPTSWIANYCVSGYRA